MITWRGMIEVTFKEDPPSSGSRSPAPLDRPEHHPYHPRTDGLVSLTCRVVYGQRDRWATLRPCTAGCLKPQATFSD